ncbi:amidohydrolase family protein [bacterium]|nr:amidohydrolase family protein [bacterium]
MTEKIINCYDSHTHFWATGQVAEGLRLFDLQKAEDISNLQINKNHYRSQWLVGFGWNHNNWMLPQFPDKHLLDKFFPDTPVFFSRVDGHTSWINSKAIGELTRLGYDFTTNPKGGAIERDAKGEPTGILLDQAHINALLKLPDFSEVQHQLFFETSQKIFNRAGFTHVRDMSMNLNAWQLLCAMEDKKNLTVNIEAFVTVENLADLARVLGEIKQIKSIPSKQMRLLGVKIFIDGSLGSKTAYLSQKYLKSDSQGTLTWPHHEIKELVRQSWQAGVQVAIHCIGDEAVHKAVLAARDVAAEGVLGRLHLEHVQILRPETVLAMKPLHVICHMQPCHWLSDHTWLKQALPASLVSYLFQWELLRKNKIPFYFGSDSPIEPTSLFNNKKALQLSHEWGVPALNADWKIYHTHPDNQWAQHHTEISQDEVKQVFFNGEPLL